MEDKGVVTRFAPSPSGYLHLGHAYSALVTASAAESTNGLFLLRIEDIDFGRCKPEFEDAIYEDLSWLGLEWAQPVRRQSDHFEEYRHALGKLNEKGVLYPCFCTRKTIAAEIERAGRAAHEPSSPYGSPYPGTCREMSKNEQDVRLGAGDPFALRLNIEKAHEITGELYWHETGKVRHVAVPQIYGDVIIARKDIPTSYHLSVTLDDHIQGITLVNRGEDLRLATHIHRLLQALLDYNVPDYRFHRVLTDENGKRYAKRDKSRSLRTMRDEGVRPRDIRKLVGL